MDKFLYKLARKINRAATITNDVKVVSSGNPKRIAKRFIRKYAYKSAHGGANSIVKKIFKWTKW